MALSDKELDIHIKATDQASGTLDKIGKRLDHLGEKFGGRGPIKDIAELFVLGGKLGAVGFIGNMLGRAAENAGDLTREFRAGEISSLKFKDNLIQSLPVIGQLWQGAKSIWRAFDDSAIALEKLAKSKAAFEQRSSANAAVFGGIVTAGADSDQAARIAKAQGFARERVQAEVNLENALGRVNQLRAEQNKLEQARQDLDKVTKGPLERSLAASLDRQIAEGRRTIDEIDANAFATRKAQLAEINKREKKANDEAFDAIGERRYQESLAHEEKMHQLEVIEVRMMRGNEIAERLEIDLQRKRDVQAAKDRGAFEKEVQDINSLADAKIRANLVGQLVGAAAGGIGQGLGPNTLPKSAGSEFSRPSSAIESRTLSGVSFGGESLIAKQLQEQNRKAAEAEKQRREQIELLRSVDAGLKTLLGV